MTDNDLYYLRSIYRRLLEFKQVASKGEYNLGFEALADEVDWLDCFIDKHERRKRKNVKSVIKYANVLDTKGE